MAISSCVGYGLYDLLLMDIALWPSSTNYLLEFAVIWWVSNGRSSETTALGN